MKWMIVFLMMFVLVGGVFAEEQEVEEAEPQVTYTSNELRTDTDPSEHIPGTLLPGDDTIAVSTGSNGNDENDPEALSPANNPGSDVNTRWNGNIYTYEDGSTFNVLTGVRTYGENQYMWDETNEAWEQILVSDPRFDVNPNTPFRSEGVNGEWKGNIFNYEDGSTFNSHTGILESGNTRYRLDSRTGQWVEIPFWDPTSGGEPSGEGGQDFPPDDPEPNGPETNGEGNENGEDDENGTPLPPEEPKAEEEEPSSVRGKNEETAFDHMAKVYGFVSTMLNFAQSPVGRFGSLLYGRNEISEMQREADQRFKEMFFYTLTDQGLTERVCSTRFPPMIGDNQVLGIDPSGRLQQGITLQAERARSWMVNETNETTGEHHSEERFVYKFAIRVSNLNVENESIRFTVTLHDERGRVVRLYDDPITLDRGRTFQRVGRGMDVVETTNKYDRICIKFSTPYRFGSQYDISFYEKGEIMEFCNRVSVVEGRPQLYIPPDYLTEGLTDSEGRPVDRIDDGTNQRPSPNV